MCEPTEAPSEDEESNEKTERQRTNEKIEEETGGIVETEHGRRYRVQVISNSGSSDIPSEI